MGAMELYQEGILTENEYEMEHYAEIYEVIDFPYENENEEMNDELAEVEVIEYEEDGEEIWLVQNRTTGKMSTGFTKRDAIHNYNEGKVFDISEWEDEK